MNKDVTLLKQNIARLRREIRKATRELQMLVDADLDCSGAARVIMHMENDLRLFLEKYEHVMANA